MTVNAFITAIAGVLYDAFPGRLVYVDQIEAGADGNHLVRCIDQSHVVGLSRQRKRSYSFEVAYFQSERNNMSFHDWAETMYWAFEMLLVEGRLYHLENAKAQKGEDMVFHFTFDVDAFLLLTEDQILMNDLEIETETKG